MSRLRGTTLPMPSNILDHPRRTKRIADAKKKIIEGISAAGLGEHALQLNQEDWRDLILAALVHELERPGSGIPVIAEALPKWEACARK
jgi:hypothetical protein